MGAGEILHGGWQRLLHLTAVGFQNDVKPKEAQVHQLAASVLPSCSGQVKSLSQSGLKREMNQFHLLMGCTKS